MKKALLLAAVVGMILGSTAVAQDSTLFFDNRDTAAEIASPIVPHINGYGSTYGGPDNAGGAGDGQMMWVTPTHGDGFETGATVLNSWPQNNDTDQNTSTGNLFLYMTVNDDASGTNGVISSVGLDFGTSELDGDVANRIVDLSYSWEAFLDNAGNAQTSAGTPVAGDPPAWEDAKAVKVPVDAVPSYAVGAGMVPGNTYKIGTYAITGGLRDCTMLGGTSAAASTFFVHMSVDGLLITRTFETGGDASELVSFGYTGGAPEAAVDGSSEFATSTEPDAVIVVQMIGDGTGDGQVFGNDIGPFVQAKTRTTTGTQNQFDCAIYDSTGDRAIFGNDIGGFVGAKNGSVVCP